MLKDYHRSAALWAAIILVSENQTMRALENPLMSLLLKRKLATFLSGSGKVILGKESCLQWDHSLIYDGQANRLC